MTPKLTDADLARIEAIASGVLAFENRTIAFEESKGAHGNVGYLKSRDAFQMATAISALIAALREARAWKDRGYAARVKALEEVAEAARDYAPVSSEHRGEGQENCMNLSCTLLRALAALDAVRGGKVERPLAKAIEPGIDRCTVQAPMTTWECGCGLALPCPYHDAPKVEESRNGPEESPQDTEESR